MRDATAETVLFDFDGLLVDSEDADAQAWLEEFDRAGAPVSMEQYAGYWTAWSWLRLVPMISRLAEAAPGTDRPAVEARRRARWRELCGKLPARPGMAAWVRDAAAGGRQVAVASNDADDRVPATLARLGLAGHVTALATAGEGIARKPAPDLYLAALARLGASADRAVAVEDSPHGLAAARAAGLRAIAVPNALTRMLPGLGSDARRDYDGTASSVARLLPGAGAAVLVSDPARTPFTEALAATMSRPGPLPPDEGPHEEWAFGAVGAAHEEPWHWATARMLHTAAAVTRLEARAGVGPRPVRRTPLVLAGLAFYYAGFLLRADSLENVPAQMAADLLSVDEAARKLARFQPVRTRRGALGEPGSPALPPADRAALDALLDRDPAGWDTARREALRLITTAMAARLFPPPAGQVLTLRYLSVYDGNFAEDFIDRPGEPALDG